MNFEIKDSSHLASVILNNGFDPVDINREKRLDIKDAIASTDISPLIPNALVEVMMVAQEPLMTLTPLLQSVQFEGAGALEYKLPAVGTFDVERVGEGENYPEKKLQIGGAAQTATIDKWGIALAFTQEAIKYSRWDLIGMHTREAGRAFGRRKESEVARHILSLGNPIFDNKNPGASQRGVTTGRGSDLAANGSFGVDDLFDMYASILHSGYQPDIMIVHPMTWLMWIKDPVMRAFAFNNGGGTLFSSYTGSAVNRYQFPNGVERVIAKGQPNGFMGTGVNGQTPSRSDISNQMNAAPQLPSYFPYPMRIVVSPYVFLDPATKLTDIVMADSSTLGALIVEESLTNDEWENRHNDTLHMKFRERYGIMIYEGGQGIGVAKNVKVETNWFSGEPARGMFDPTTLSVIDPATPVV